MPVGLRNGPVMHRDDLDHGCFSPGIFKKLQTILKTFKKKSLLLAGYD
jgi:hypothetical protein